MLAMIADATRLATWQTLKVYGDESKTKSLEPPEPLRRPWDETPEDDAKDGATAGPIDDNSAAGTRRFGDARMTTEQVDDWLGWAQTDN